MRTSPFVFSVFSFLSCLLTNCQSPKIKVVVNHLKPGMLKGKTVGVEGMEITAASWPGKFIEEPILDKAEKDLQHRLKGARVCLLNEDGTIQDRLKRESGNDSGGSVAALAKAHAKEPDYIFRIMLKEKAVNHTVIKQSLVGNGRLRDIRNPGFHAFGGWEPNSYPSGGGRSGEYWRVINKRVLKADYILSDSRTHRLIWRAEVESSKLFNGDYRNTSQVEARVPLKPFWISMNTAAVRTLK